ncbi:MAG: gluconate 2-dehydrogenase subunit 3 family protein [Betaproteobacteria bacterium]
MKDEADDRGGERSDPPAAPIDRRELLRRAGAIPIAGLAFSAAALEAAHAHAAAQGASAGEAKKGLYQPRFFTAQEWALVRVLGDMVIPADGRSGSATDALVPEFIDFLLTDPLSGPQERERLQTQLRGGLAWLDRECAGTFGRGFVACTDGERKAVLDSIAWPERARPELAAGAAFFTAFRDLVASGFWTSRMGIEDLGYTGNTYVAEWKGCPAEVLSALGLGEK